MQKLPVGLSDFKQVIEKNYYYVDKSLLIKELMDQGAVAMLIPRPRRFGKTLNLSMLRCFFEKTESDTSHLFRRLKIWQAGEEYTSRQGKYPVIYLTFKDIKEPNWASALEKIKRLIQEEFLRHNYLRNEKVLETEEQEYFVGLLVWLSGRYEVKSPAKRDESGYGRYDAMLIPRDPRAAGIIIEFKKVNTKRGETKESAFAKAFQQIEKKGYAAELQQRGIQQIRELAIVFKGKQVSVKEKQKEHRAKRKGSAPRGHSE
ncbi:MAG: AAA family ATPase [bacterium]